MKNSEQPEFASAAFYHPDGGICHPQEGLTKREYFAAMAMQGIIMHHGVTLNRENPELERFISKRATGMADRLLKELDNNANGTD